MNLFKIFLILFSISYMNSAEAIWGDDGGCTGGRDGFKRKPSEIEEYLKDPYASVRIQIKHQMWDTLKEETQYNVTRLYYEFNGYFTSDMMVSGDIYVFEVRNESDNIRTNHDYDSQPWLELTYLKEQEIDLNCLMVEPSWTFVMRGFSPCSPWDMLAKSGWFSRKDHEKMIDDMYTVENNINMMMHPEMSLIVRDAVKTYIYEDIANGKEPIFRHQLSDTKYSVFYKTLLKISLPAHKLPQDILNKIEEYNQNLPTYSKFRYFVDQKTYRKLRTEVFKEILGK